MFAFGFAKSARDNIDEDDEADLKKAAKLTLGFGDADMDKLVSQGTLVEVDCDGEGEGERNL